MTAIDFDHVLSVVGERGRYQTLMFFVLCVPATVPVAFLTFSNLFITAVPDHWCSPTRSLNLSAEDLKFVSVPRAEDGYEKCLAYDMDSSPIFDELVNGSHVDGMLDEDWKRRFEAQAREGRIGVKPCERGWEHDKTYYESTLITELNLFCENSWSQQTSTALFYVGSIFGNAFFGWAADRWGRRTSTLWMIFLEVLVSIVTSFSKDYQTYLVLRTIGGLFFPSMYQIPFILGIELMAPKHRPLAGMIICLMFALSMCFLSLLAYMLRDWFTLSIATSVPFLLLYSYYWIIPESPRWLFSKGRLDEAEEVLERMAKFNGVTLPKKILHQLQHRASLMSPLMSQIQKIDDGHSSSKKKKSKEVEKCDSGINIDETPVQYDKSDGSDRLAAHENDADDPWNLEIDDKKSLSKSTGGDGASIVKKYSFVEDSTSRIERARSAEVNLCDMMRFPNVRRKFLLLTFVWIANAVVYMGLSYNVTNLGVNDYLAFFISAAIEIPSNLIAWKLMDVWGRKWLLCLTLAIAGFFCLCCSMVPEDQVWVTVGFAMIGKFGVAASFTVFYVFVGESFPTVIRSQAMAASSLMSSCGLLIFPYILELGSIWRMLPFAVLGVLALCGSLANLFLPDTLNQPMPQTLEDGEEFGRDIKTFSKPRGKPYEC